VRQDHAALLGDARQGPHPVGDLLPVAFGRFSFRDEEREHPDDRGAEAFGHVADAAQSLQLGSERRVDWDLADRRADRGYPYPRVIQFPAQPVHLGVAEVCDIGRPHTAQLEVRHALGGEHSELLAQVLRDLVGEPAENERHDGMTTVWPSRADS
jgi:hypothetical protein